MSAIKDLSKDFLESKSIAVVGVSRDSKKTANFIYKKLRSEGYTIFAVNPNTAIAEGDTCYPNLKAIPSTPEAVFIITKPAISEQVVKECAELGIKKVWMHKGIDAKAHSVSPAATDFCRQQGITVIPGGCPMMYCRHADTGHRFMRWLLTLTGTLPKNV